MPHQVIHLKAKPGDIAENVIAVGDPGRVELLSKLLSDSRVVNTHRGFLTITGRYKDIKVTLATHGIGGPSAAIIFEELKMLGAKRIVRIGTAGGLVKEVKIGSIVLATGAGMACNGAGLNLYAPNHCLPTSPDPVLTFKIKEKLDESNIEYHLGPVYSSDSFYAEDPELAHRLSKLGYKAIEMECATLFALGWMRGFKTAALLVISDNLIEEKKTFLTTMELKEQFETLAKIVMEVFNELGNER
ncbi:MAG: nucleoside phosphorylase [Thermoprotei archaeon]|nr:MAG: nucleoside phosphorylase [Thermoprotei archaeon]